ncbi:peptidase M23-like protein [Neolewinella xylanilytica]|uniref:Peptidase M23-like protein n=1 Tax=Neolewinella xylanilytica TaxID=1514080 RepID=A0A2S6I7R8_9BACT|nr:M23 family metallopeptidase [Neolewinella xylanilytica]PPK87546.1 peptidase M23-like protein [Neolewinella xylanilytica]
MQLGFRSLLLLFVLTGPVMAQYQPPLSGPLLVTGTFGELRSNHFHGGLDFRGPVGTPVRSVAAGYVSRVVVSPGGFGQAVYVSHPDGKRTVYGHLEVLSPEIKDTIRALQYETESFSIDFRPDSTAFPVTAGQVIGGVGNRGFSFGPHLHFEVWDAATETRLNPLSLGFTVPDTRRPTVSAVRVYQLSNDGNVLGSKTYSVVSTPLPDTLIVDGPRVGLGLQAIDRQNSLPNRNGIYRARLLADSMEVFGFTYDRIPYVKSEYVNALTDYAEYQRTANWYYRLYAPLPEAAFWETSSSVTSPGTIDLTRQGVREITIIAADYAGNESVFRTVLKYAPPEPATDSRPATAGYQYFLPRGEESIVDTAGMRLELAADALYTDLRFSYVRLPESSAGYLSDVHQLQDRETPLHGSATLIIAPDRVLTNRQRQAAYVGRCNKDGSYGSMGGEWTADGRMMAEIGTFGDYTILMDTVPPRIRIRDFRTDLRGRSSFSLLVDDAVGGTLDYRAMVDGKWALMEYDAKSGTLTYTFEDDRIAPGTSHEFQLRVTDARGNSSEFERTFRR